LHRTTSGEFDWNFFRHRASSRRQKRPEDAAMHLSNESLLVILFVGLVAGWLAGQIMRGYGFGLIADILIGIVGAFIGHWLLPWLGIRLGTGIISAIVNATIGAIILLVLIRLVHGGSGWGWRRRSWGRRW
jgi:uncharacterized membrane protein YeaQ/YmgE (transglycosylase-associated protein family)